MNFLIDFSVGEKIALCGVIIAAVGVAVKIILHFWPRKMSESRNVEVDAEFILSKAIGEAERKGRSEEQIDQFKGELVKALERVRQLETKGNRPDATEAIQELRKSGDMRRLQELLIKDRGERCDALIERNYEIAAVAYLRGDINVALAATDEVLRLQPNDVIALSQKGHICRLQGNLEEAEKAYLRVKELGVEARNEEWQSVASGNLGLIYQLRGELDKGEEMHNKALEINKKLGWLEGMASEYGNLGVIYGMRGQLDKAEEMFNKVLEIEEKLGRPESISKAYGSLGLTYRRRGELDKAKEIHNKALEIDERLGRLKGMASDYGNMGSVYYTKGDLDKAEEMHKKSLEIAEKVGLQEEMANQYGNLGLIYKMRGDKKKVIEYWEEALSIFKKIGMHPEVEKTQWLIDGLEEK